MAACQQPRRGASIAPGMMWPRSESLRRPRSTSTSPLAPRRTRAKGPAARPAPRAVAWALPPSGAKAQGLGSSLSPSSPKDGLEAYNASQALPPSLPPPSHFLSLALALALALSCSLSIYLPTYLPTYLPSFLPTYLPLLSRCIDSNADGERADTNAAVTPDCSQSDCLSVCLPVSVCLYGVVICSANPNPDRRCVRRRRRPPAATGCQPCPQSEGERPLVR